MIYTFLILFLSLQLPLVGINGSELFYEYYAGETSATVIFEAGAQGNSHAWQHVTSGLQEEGISYLVYDRAGHGNSTESENERTIDQISNDLSSLIERLEIENDLILVGHSMGGIYQQYFAAKNKKRVRSLILIDVPHYSWEERLSGCMTDEQFENRARNIEEFRSTATQALKEESVNGRSSFEAVKKAKVPEIPVVVLYGGSQSWPEALDGDCLTEAWNISQQLYLEEFKKSKIEVSGISGHHVPMDDPELVVSTLKSLF